jgi:hypothetical protein
VSAIRERFPHVGIVETGANLGFAGGSNVGIRRALARGAEYVLLLNNDTVVPPDFLRPLVQLLAAHQGVGAVQPLLMRYGQEGTIDSLGQEIGTFVARDIGFGQTSELIPDAPREVFGPCHAAVLFRRDVFERVGLLDERFFMVFEDVDFSWRMRELGISSWLEPRSVVHHKRGVSGQTANRRVRYHIGKNGLYVKVRYHPMRPADLVATLTTFLRLSASSVRQRCAFAFWSFTLDALVNRFSYRAVDHQIYTRWVRR